ncbi:hypothetical protein [Erysipelothrix aquatica]|uniref:hypothetical protein n=1 Tax=Erysipelothrix aquatica TaxID=2683714 RepID=UPI001357DE52|nr:hypothetical protein [Erysipelothrix aquatica]
MKNLLSAKTLRYLKIIDITRETGVVTFDMIQAVNSSSKNTVYADLEFMREQWGEFLDIRVNKNNVFISNNAMQDFIEVRKELFRNEIGIRFLLNIFENPTHTIVDHALDLSYSESHLRKIVIEINKFMKQFKSEVVYNQNNALVYTTTSEGHLNYAIAEIIKFSDLEPTLPTVDRQVFAEVLNYVSTYKNVEAVHIVDNIEMIIRVAMYRIQTHQTTETAIVDQFRNTVLAIDHETFHRDFVDSVERNFDALFDRTKIDAESYETFLDTLYILVIWARTFPVKIDTIMNRHAIFYKEFKRQNSYYANYVELGTQALGKDLGIDLLPFVDDMVFHIYNNIPHLRNYKRLDIAIHSDLGFHHTQAIIAFLMKYFNTQHFFEFDPKKEFDLLLSTTSSIFRGTPIIKKLYPISDLPNDRDIQNIFRLIQYTQKV